MFSKLFSLFKKRAEPQREYPRPVRSPSIKDAKSKAPNDSLSRTAERERDKSLAAESHAWVMSLPPSRRPKGLAAKYPRICNHLAIIWPDDHLVEHYFDGLLIDGRGGRKGFAPDVAAELINLHEYFVDTRSISGAKTRLWDDRSLAVGDR